MTRRSKPLTLAALAAAGTLLLTGCANLEADADKAVEMFAQDGAAAKEAEVDGKHVIIHTSLNDIDQFSTSQAVQMCNWMKDNLKGYNDLSVRNIYGAQLAGLDGKECVAGF